MNFALFVFPFANGRQSRYRPKKWTHNRLTKISTDPTPTDRFFFVGWLLRVLFFSDAAENFGYVSTMFHWLTFDSDINNARP